MSGKQPGTFICPKEFLQGAFLPNCIMRLRDLSPGAKLVLARLFQYSNDDGVAWPKHETLADEVGKSKRHAMRLVKELETKGFVLIERAERGDRLLHKSNRYRFPNHPAYHRFLVTHVTSIEQIQREQIQLPNAATRRVTSVSPKSPNPKPSNRKRVSPRQIKSALKTKLIGSAWHRLSKRFCQMVKCAHKIDRSSNELSYAKDLLLLHTREKVSQARIARTLKWYCRSIEKGIRLPHADTTRQFRYLFGTLEAKMRESEGAVADAKWATEAKRIHRRFEQQGRASMPSAAAISNLLGKVQKVRLAIGRANGVGTLRQTMFDAHGIPWAEAYGQWIVLVTSRWDSWSGRLDEFKPGGKYFLQYVENKHREMWETRLTDKQRKAIAKACASVK